VWAADNGKVDCANLLMGSAVLQATAVAEAMEEEEEGRQEAEDSSIRALLSAREHASGCTALMRAAYQGHAPMVRLLLREAQERDLFERTMKPLVEGGDEEMEVSGERDFNPMSAIDYLCFVL
jgi:hypothetical protein